MIYLYAIADGLSDVSDIRGIVGEPLQRLDVEPFTIVAGDLSTAPHIDREILAEQDRVVRELHDAASALLPMRFGAAYASVEEVARATKVRGAALQDALILVRGKEQMTMRITGGPLEPSRPAASGTDYLLKRAASATPSQIAPLLDALKPLQRATRVETAKTAGLIATVYQLIDRGSSDDYATRVENVARLLHGLTVRISGPGPCYAFAS